MVLISEAVSGLSMPVSGADRNRQLVARDQIGDDHVFYAQAGGLHDFARVLKGGGLE